VRATGLGPQFYSAANRRGDAAIGRFECSGANSAARGGSRRGSLRAACPDPRTQGQDSGAPGGIERTFRKRTIHGRPHSRTPQYAGRPGRDDDGGGRRGRGCDFGKWTLSRAGRNRFVDGKFGTATRRTAADASVRRFAYRRRSNLGLDGNPGWENAQGRAQHGLGVGRSFGTARYRARSRAGHDQRTDPDPAARWASSFW